MDVRHMEKQSKKILDVFSDGRITGFDLIYLAFYTVVNAYPDVVLDRLIEYTDHVKYERERMKENKNYVQDTLF